MQPSQDRAAEPALDPRALGVHEQVDDAADEPRDDQSDRDPSFARGVEQRAKRRAKDDCRDGERLIDAKTMRDRPARRHGDEIGAGEDGQENAERRRVHAGANQNRAGGSAPEPDADAEGEEHRGDRHMELRAEARRAGRRDGAQ